MPREKFQILTEQMFYILLCLREECCGTDIMEKVREMTKGRVMIGPGTLYNLLESFEEVGAIRQTRAEGRKRNYIITYEGKTMLKEEYQRLQKQMQDYEQFMREEEGV